MRNHGCIHACGLKDGSVPNAPLATVKVYIRQHQPHQRFHRTLDYHNIRNSRCGLQRTQSKFYDGPLNESRHAGKQALSDPRIPDNSKSDQPLSIGKLRRQGTESESCRRCGAAQSIRAEENGLAMACFHQRLAIAMSVQRSVFIERTQFLAAIKEKDGNCVGSIADQISEQKGFLFEPLVATLSSSFPSRLISPSHHEMR